MDNKNQDNKKGRGIKSILIIFLIFLLGFILGGIGNIIFGKIALNYLSKIPFLSENEFFKIEESQVIIQKEEKILTNEDPHLQDLLKRVSASIVGIIEIDNLDNNEKHIINKINGSGFVITANGLIVTSANILKNSEIKYGVITSDGKIFEVENIIEDPASDISFINIKADGLSVVEWGISDDIAVGEKVFSFIKDQFGNIQIESSIINNKNYYPSFPQTTEKIEGYIKTGINDIFLGSPLYNLDGKVIGLNITKEDSELLSMPADEIKLIIDDVIKNNSITRPMLGIQYVNINENIANSNNLSVEKGILIYSPDNKKIPAVIEPGPAFAAGLQYGDIITRIGDDEIDRDSNIHRILKNYKIGDNIEIEYQRDSEKIKSNIIIKGMEK